MQRANTHAKPLRLGKYIEAMAAASVQPQAAVTTTNRGGSFNRRGQFRIADCKDDHVSGMHVGPSQHLEVRSIGTEALDARLGPRPVTADEAEYIDTCAYEAASEGDAYAAGTDDRDAQCHWSVLVLPAKLFAAS
jgi:hypothetical protein